MAGEIICCFFAPGRCSLWGEVSWWVNVIMIHYVYNEYPPVGTLTLAWKAKEEMYHNSTLCFHCINSKRTKARRSLDVSSKTLRSASSKTELGSKQSTRHLPKIRIPIFFSSHVFCCTVTAGANLIECECSSVTKRWTCLTVPHFSSWTQQIFLKMAIHFDPPPHRIRRAMCG